MKKMFSLLKATMSQDMDLFKFKTKSHKQTNKLLFPIFMALVLMFSIGNLANLFMQELPNEFQFIVLTIFITGVSVLTMWEGIYKSQGILFSARDNDLLFSLPISKRKIFCSRIIKLLTFQFLFNFLFALPAFAVYAYYIHPEASFYITSAIMLIVLPMLPTTIGSILGYIVKQISSKFKAKKFIEILFTSLILVGVFYLSFAMEGIVSKLGENALHIQKTIETIYYPIKLYMNLINNFNILDLLMLVVINVIPLTLFIYIASLSYFKISSKNMETYASSSRKNKGLKINFKSKLSALISKELKRFFSSTVYIVNAGFSIVLILVITIFLSVNFEGTINTIASKYETNIDVNEIINMLPKLFFCLVILMSFMSSITSSMISIEGKSFNITKSLPVKLSKILFAKVLASSIITIPAIIISDLIFFFRFNVGLIDILLILIASIICPTLNAIIGLIINLKYPNMNAKSDTEIVKQSMSSMISVFLGMGIGGLAVFGTLYYGYKMNINLFILLELIVFTIALAIMGYILKKYGTKKFKEINV